VAEYESQSKEKVGPSCSTQMETCDIIYNKIIRNGEKAFLKLKSNSLSLHSAPHFSEAFSPLPHVAFLSPSFSIEAPNKASTFGAHFRSKSQKEGISGVVKCVSTSGTSKFQVWVDFFLLRFSWVWGFGRYDGWFC